MESPFEFLQFYLIMFLFQDIVFLCQFFILLFVGDELILQLTVFFFRFTVDPFHLFLFIQPEESFLFQLLIFCLQRLQFSLLLSQLLDLVVQFGKQGWIALLLQCLNGFILFRKVEQLMLVDDRLFGPNFCIESIDEIHQMCILGLKVFQRGHFLCSLFELYMFCSPFLALLKQGCILFFQDLYLAFQLLVGYSEFFLMLRLLIFSHIHHSVNLSLQFCFLLHEKLDLLLGIHQLSRKFVDFFGIGANLGVETAHLTLVLRDQSLILARSILQLVVLIQEQRLCLLDGKFIRSQDIKFLQSNAKFFLKKLYLVILTLNERSFPGSKCQFFETFQMAVNSLQIYLHLFTSIAQLSFNSLIQVFLAKEVAHMSQFFEYKLGVFQFILKGCAFPFQFLLFTPHCLQILVLCPLHVMTYIDQASFADN